MSPENDAFVADAVICARNCGSSLGAVVASLPNRRLRSVVAVDLDSADQTAQVARDAGCVVLRESSPAYGAGCKRAVAHLEALPRPPDAVVFVAGDGSDPVDQVAKLLDPIVNDNAELVIGVRPGSRGPGSRVALGLIGILYRHRFADLGPFRAVRFPALVALAVGADGSGWDAEMQVKAVNFGLHIVEVPLETAAAAKQRAAPGSLKRTGRVLLRILRHATAR